MPGSSGPFFQKGFIAHGSKQKVTNVVSVDNNSTTCGANARLQLLLENSMSKKGHNYVKKNLRATCPTGMGSPFDSKQLV